jgi:hypothetical protein
LFVTSVAVGVTRCWHPHGNVTEYIFKVSGWPGQEIIILFPAEAKRFYFLLRVQTGCGLQPALYLVGAEEDKMFCIVPRLRMSKFITVPPSPHILLCRGKGDIYFYLGIPFPQKNAGTAD